MKYKKMKFVSPNQMCEAVNKFDKDHGIKLKHPSIWDEPDRFRMIYQARSEMNIAGILCILNGIDVSDYTEEDETYGMIQKPIGIMHASFVEDSCLKWNESKTYETGSLIFRCRFLTLLLFQFIGNIDRAVDGEWVSHRKKYYYHSESEQKIMINKKVIDYSIRLTNLMLTNSTYCNTILKINELVNYTRKKNQKNFNKEFLGNVLALKKGLKKDPITGVFMDEDIAIFTMIKIAYMAATNKSKDINKLPSFAELENSGFHYNLSAVFRELGKRIIKASRSKKNLSLMFRAYLEARPAIWTQLKTKGDPELEIGIAAIDFMAFMLNDPNVTRCVNEMKRKGK